MTAKTPDGKNIGTEKRYYHPQATNEKNCNMIYSSQVKVANIRDTSIQPFQTKTESIEFILPEHVETVDIAVDLSYYLGTPTMRYSIHKVDRRVNLDR